MNNKQHGRENDSVEVVPEVTKSDVALREEAIERFWVEHDIFHKSIATPAGEAPKGNFVFYDGPPFATGTPHYGHILAGTIKDAIPRFWTMNGMRVERKWGWDCHGLPLENLIEKKLGLATKRDIESFGVKNFNEAARSAVMEYADVWKQVVPRMGRFADMEDDYKTMDSTYTESVWWVFSELHKKGLVFEGFKTMHLCPRCGTTLSNFEVNQGYKDIKDIAVTVKLPLLDEQGNVTDTSLLVWTTTPWTLPGNLAAAVHNDIEYVKVKVENEGFLILAKGRLAQLGDVAYEIVEEIKGSNLVGRSYQPPFDYLKKELADKYSDEEWKIYHADYVELGEEGTGVVHIAPAYGDDDMKLAQANNILIQHHVDTAGHFMDFVTDFAGRLVKPKDDDAAGVDHKDTDIEILKALQATGKIFKKENITHSYPHCWRCDTPLLNYATTSWFVNVPKIKDELVAANNAVHWVPEHVGTNRFGKWLEGARDWAVSRQRYWGAPLPIWRNPVTGDYKVFGSLAELQQYIPKSGNKYIAIRHGEAESNIAGIINSDPSVHDPLSEKGRAQCVAAAETLRQYGITHIVHTGIERTRETAELIAEALGLPATAISSDVRMTEHKIGGEYEGKTWKEFNLNFSSEEEKFVKQLPGVESRYDLIARVGEFLYDFDATHQNETVLVVGHASSIFALQCVAEGADHARVLEIKKAGYFKNTEIKPLQFTPVPHNDNYALDYHRPYIDNIKLVDTDGTPLVRVPDVFDCWFESGSMPYAQHHFMGENREAFEATNFPAQFIAEGLDQTRGWFYSLIVLGTALFGKSPYENVIVNGLVLAEDGKKMSKSLKNYPDPMELADRVGVDAMRYYLLSAPIMRGEDLNFSEKEVLELQRKNIGRLHNVLAMYEMYADGTEAKGDSTNILDRWIVSRLNELIAESTTWYKAYELDKATRPIADFIDDVSVWYLRRSRERLKSDDAADKTLTLGTLRFIMRELAKVMAPAMPFYAEYLYRAVRTESESESVHLCAWPAGGNVDQDLIAKMSEVRMFVTQGLEARTKANIKVRQPLSELFITTNVTLDDELKALIMDELNVKGITLAHLEEGKIAYCTLATELTPELLAEGAVREVMRAVQDMRKDAGLEPSDRITLTIDTNEAGQAAITAHRELLVKTVGASDVVFAQAYGTTVTPGDYTFTLSIEKQ
jgi:isoleucyl-tRNA synthetase